MFSRRVHSFKIILEYGKDALGEQAHLLPGVQVRLTKALATLEFEFNSDENETAVIERFTQAKSRIAFDRLEERVVVKFSQHNELRQRINVKLSVACVSPAIRSLQVARTSASGSVPEALLTALLKHCDLSGVWKLRGAEGFGNFWCSCCEARSWRSLANMNLSACGLAVLPPALSSLGSLRILRLSHNKLTSLPAEVSALTALEVLAADHNQLTSVPSELRHCSSLRHLELEDNRLATPVLDLRALSNLISLQLYGNPLEYLPELSPASALRSLSLANVRIMADAAYTRWEVEVAPLPYISRGHKLALLFQLTFRRSSCQHPLLAGALGRISEDRSHCELMAREETAIQQLVLMALSEQPVVAEQACRTLGALAQLGPATARRLLGHDVQSTLVTLLRSPRRASKLCGLTLLGSMAAAADAVSAELLTPELLQQLQAAIQADDRDPRVAALTALAHLSFCRENKIKIHAAEELLAAVKELAGAVTPAAGVDAGRSLPRGAAPAAQAALTGGPRPDGAIKQLQFQSQQAARSARVSTSPARRTTAEASTAEAAMALLHPAAVASSAAPAALAVVVPSVVRMPTRAAAVAGGGGVQRHSDTGSGPVPLVSSWVGSPPGPSGWSISHGRYGGQGRVASSAASGLSSKSVGGGAAVSATPGTHRVPGPTAGQPAGQPQDALSPPQPQQQPRPLHHSASTPATIGMGTAPGSSSSTGGVAVPTASSARALTQLQASGGGAWGGSSGPLSPTSPTAADANSSCSLPPQLALAPPRAVPEPVALQDPCQLLAIKVLAILGENDHVRRALGQPPIAGRGVRVLALDGGGMRGLALVQMMRHIERRAGRPLHQLFDLVVGTSTGAIVAVGLGVFHFSLDQCEAIYTGLGHKVFNQAGASGAGASPREELLAAAQAQAQAAAQAAASAAASGATAGSSSSGWRDSLFRVVRGTSTNLRVAVYGFKHDATTFEELLRQMCELRKLGCVSNQLIDAAALGSPKVAAVATQVSCCPVTPFLFTSYELPPRAAAAAAAMRACPSSSRHLVWQAVRASSAAPYYLDDFVCGDDRFQDGAATANNPSILALQQARLLWPGLQLDALVSLGCGAAPPVRRERGAHAVLDTGAVLVDAATSPDRADEALSTLLPLVPGARYFRFQPVHERCAMELDDVNPQHWAALRAAVDEYCTAHAARFDEVVNLLLSGREGDFGPGEGQEQGVDTGQHPGGGEEAAEEAAFEVLTGVGPEGGPLPAVPRVRLGARRGMLVIEARSPACGPGGYGRWPPDERALAAEDVVAAALAQQPNLLRRCDLAVTAADAALSAALAEAHMCGLEEQGEELRRWEAAAAEGSPPPGVTQEPRRGASAGEVLAAPAAEDVAKVAEAPEAAESTGCGQLHVPRPAVPSGVGAGETCGTSTGLMSPPRMGAPGQPARVSGGARHWLSGSGGRGGLSAGGRVMSAAAGGEGSAGPLEVAGELVEAEAAAAAAEALGMGAATCAPEPVVVQRAAAAAAGPSSVADAAAEAAAAGADAASAAGAAAGSAGPGGSSSNIIAAAGASAAATATSLLYDFLWKRSTSARSISAGGGAAPGSSAGAGAATPTAAVPTSTGPAADTPGPVCSTHPAEGTVSSQEAAPLSLRAVTSSFSLPCRSPASMASDASLPTPLLGSAAQPTDRSHSLAAPNRKAPDSASSLGAAEQAPAAPPSLRQSLAGGITTARRGAADVRGCRGVDGAVAAAAPREVCPSALVAALLQDLQGRCGLLHLGLRPLYGTDGNDTCYGKDGYDVQECGLVASWKQEVVAVVDPGPDASRILAELGYPGGGGASGPSLSSLFSDARGLPLGSNRCHSYQLLARQEVWHSGSLLVTLLLQVTRPASLLRPGDLASMAAQLDGLLVSSAAPLPPPITTALLQAGAAAVICPHAPLPPNTDPLKQQQQTQPVNPIGGSTHDAAPALQSLVHVVPYSIGIGSVAVGGQRNNQVQATATSGYTGVGSAGASVAEVAAYFTTLVGELVGGATVRAALTAADRQHAALRGCMVFHHL